MSSRRIGKELGDLARDDDQSGVVVKLAGDGSNVGNLEGTFPGPMGTPYEGGTFRVEIKMLPDYPFKPPLMKFITKIWHPNVSSQTGAICLDTLGSAWSPILTIKSALISLQSLLSSPEPGDPQDAEVAHMMLHDPEQFKRFAHEWAVLYAGAPPSEASGAAAESQPIYDDTGITPPAAPRQPQQQQQQQQPRPRDLGGYHEELIGKFCNMGFAEDIVVEAFKKAEIDTRGGEYYQLNDAQLNDVTVQLLSE